MPAEAPPAIVRRRLAETGTFAAGEFRRRVARRPDAVDLCRTEAATGAVVTRRRYERGPAQVTVLKSGVVDGMAYSLYSDGSIEAQMPEGMMRFASIDELRSHLDQRP